MQRIITLFFALTLAASGYAQEGLKIGLRFSPIYSYARVVDASGNRVSDDLSGRLGISYGLMVNYGLGQGSTYGLSTGIHIVNSGFSRMGSATAVGTDSTVNAEQKWTFTTVEIPVTVKLRTSEIGSGFYANGFFGGSVNFTAGNKNVYTGLNPQSDLRGEGTLQREAQLVNPLSFSFIFGAGGEYEVGSVGVLSFGLVYHQGLTNLNRQGKFESLARGASEKYRLNYFSLELGFFFGN